MPDPSDPSYSTSARPRARLELPYRLCDVFTATPLQGNQLAVFEDAGDLTSAEMQKLANETNLSETTFILRREAEIERREGVRVRIFTTREELPFAGHPTLGTAATIRSFFPEYAEAEEIVLDLNAGKIPVRYAADQQNGGAPYGVMTQAKPVFGALHDPAEAAAALGLPLEDLLPGAVPQTVSTGLAQCIVPLRSLEALGRLSIPQREAAAYLAGKGGQVGLLRGADPRRADRLAGADAVLQRRRRGNRLGRRLRHRVSGRASIGRLGRDGAYSPGRRDRSPQRSFRQRATNPFRHRRSQGRRQHRSCGKGPCFP